MPAELNGLTPIEWWVLGCGALTFVSGALASKLAPSVISATAGNHLAFVGAGMALGVVLVGNL